MKKKEMIQRIEYLEKEVNLLKEANTRLRRRLLHALDSDFNLKRPIKRTMRVRLPKKDDC